jgi:hypothetical protein
VSRVGVRRGFAGLESFLVWAATPDHLALTTWHVLQRDF